MYFQNPDRLWFKKNLSHFLRGQRGMRKYEYLFDQFYQNEIVKVLLPVYPKSNLLFYPLVFLRLIKFILWCLINNLDIRKFKLKFRYSEIGNNEKIFIFFHDNLANYPTLCSKTNYLNALAKTKAHFFIHMSHFLYNVREGANNLALIKNFTLISENKLEIHSSLFKKFFKGISTSLLPFAIEQRFQKLENVEKKNFAVATGAIPPDIDDEDFYQVYGHRNLQNQRQSILHSKDMLKEVDILINKFNFKKLNIFEIILQNLKKIFESNENTYQSLDIVHVYNQYDVVICTHETIGVVGIGILEGICCGLCPLTENRLLLEELGLVEGMNFIEYDGSISDLKAKIHLLKKNRDLLNEIKNNNFELRKRFHADSIYKKFNDIISQR